MSNDILDYIKLHLEDVRQAYTVLSQTDTDVDYYEGSIETLEHLLAKFGE